MDGIKKWIRWWKTLYPPIPPHDKLLLSPWLKWKKYNRFPWKVLLHVSLALLVIGYAMFLYATVSTYSRANINTLSSHIIGDSDSQTLEIYDTDTFWKVYQNILSSYFDIPSLIGSFAAAGGNLPAPGIELDAWVFDEPLVKTNPVTGDYTVVRSSSISHSTYTLTKTNPEGPFLGMNSTQRSDYIHRISELDCSYFLENAYASVFGIIPVLWHVTVTMERTDGIVYFSLQAHIEDMVAPSLYLGIALALESSLILLGFVSMVLSARSFAQRIVLYWRVRKNYRSIPEPIRRTEGYPEWKEYPWSMAVPFLDAWDGIHVFVCICLIASVAVNMLDRLHLYESVPSMAVLAFASAGVTINILRYFEYLKQFYVLLSTLRVSVPHVLRYFLTAFPIYFAYVLMGVLLFSPYASRFRSLSLTSITLFTVVSGDSIHAAFDNCMSNYPYPWVCEVYLYSFVGLFITSILPLFLFIIDDAYQQAKDLARRGDEDLEIYIDRRTGSGENSVAPWKNPDLLDVRMVFVILRREGRGGSPVVFADKSGARAYPQQQQPSETQPLHSSDSPSINRMDESSTELDMYSNSPSLNVTTLQMQPGTPDVLILDPRAGSSLGASPELRDHLQVEFKKMRADILARTSQLLHTFSERQRAHRESFENDLLKEVREIIDRETLIAYSNVLSWSS